LIAFHQGELPVSRLDAIAEHLEHCPACEAAAQRLDSEPNQTDDLLRLPAEAAVPLTCEAGQTDGDASMEEEDIPPPSCIGSYQILEELGRGGMGVVYKAFQPSLRRVVAVKVILGGPLAGATTQARFRVEAEALARLSHPNIVQVYEIGEYDAGGVTVPFLALEFCEGGSLSEQPKGKLLSPRQAAEWLRTLAEAAHAAHRAGIIHRDLKPANVLLDRDGRLKVSDFGLARLLVGGGPRTQTGIAFGTPEYMAPEQSTGGVLGPAVDVYSLGAILYAFLTGRPPFRGDTPMETLAQLREQEPVPPRQLRPGCPRDLETICLKCLEKAPGRRYASAQALAEDCDAFLAGRPISARPLGRLGRGWRWCRRNPAVAGLLAALALSLVGGTVAATLFGVEAGIRAREEGRLRRDATEAKDRAEEREKEAQAGRYIANLRLAQRAWDDDDLGRLRELLAGERPERTGGLDLRDFEWRYWDRLSRSERWSVAGHGRAVTAAALDPTGRRLASGSEDGTVQVWDLGSSAAAVPASVVLGQHTSGVSVVAFSPDGKRLASGDSGGRTLVWDLPGGQTLPGPVQPRLVATHAKRVDTIAFSPDGKRLASASRLASAIAFSPDGEPRASISAINPPGTLIVSEVESGREAIRLSAQVIRLAFTRDGRALLTASPGSAPLQRWDLTVQPPRPISLANRFGPEPLCGMALSRDGRRLAIVDMYGTLQVGDLTESGTAFVPRGTWRGRHVDERTNFVFGCNLAFSDDGWRLALVNRRVLDLYDLKTGQIVRTFKGHENSIRCLAFHPDGRLVSGGWDGTLRLWDTRHGQEKRTLTPSSRRVGRRVFVALSPDGRFLAAAGFGTAALWDAPGWQTGTGGNRCSCHRRTTPRSIPLRAWRSPPTAAAWRLPPMAVCFSWSWRRTDAPPDP
jgi:WD40 repeat protein